VREEGSNNGGKGSNVGDDLSTGFKGDRVAAIVSSSLVRGV
jgi:hypothetical protein